MLWSTKTYNINERLGSKLNSDIFFGGEAEIKRVEGFQFRSANKDEGLTQRICSYVRTYAYISDVWVTPVELNVTILHLKNFHIRTHVCVHVCVNMQRWVHVSPDLHFSSIRA